jgi:hypothetical protein
MPIVKALLDELFPLQILFAWFCVFNPRFSCEFQQTVHSAVNRRHTIFIIPRISAKDISSRVTGDQLFFLVMPLKNGSQEASRIIGDHDSSDFASFT